MRLPRCLYSTFFKIRCLPGESKGTPDRATGDFFVEFLQSRWPGCPKLASRCLAGIDRVTGLWRGLVHPRYSDRPKNPNELRPPKGNAVLGDLDRGTAHLLDWVGGVVRVKFGPPLYRLGCGLFLEGDTAEMRAKFWATPCGSRRMSRRPCWLSSIARYKSERPATFSASVLQMIASFLGNATG